MSSQYQSYIWAYLMGDIQNEIGVAALMGNLQAESGLIPYRKQGDFTTGYTKSLSYTNAINNGSYSESQFVNDEIGYGLAQWTYYTRKQAYYDFYQSGHYSSIGLADLGCAYLLHELQNDYPTVYTALLNATSIREASNIVLTQFERPLDQSEAVKQYRASLGQTIYNDEHGTTPTPTPPPPPPEPEPTPKPSSSIPIWMMFKMNA